MKTLYEQLTPEDQKLFKDSITLKTNKDWNKLSINEATWIYWEKYPNKVFDLTEYIKMFKR